MGRIAEPVILGYSLAELFDELAWICDDFIFIRLGDAASPFVTILHLRGGMNPLSNCCTGYTLKNVINDRATVR